MGGSTSDGNAMSGLLGNASFGGFGGSGGFGKS